MYFGDFNCLNGRRRQREVEVEKDLRQEGDYALYVSNSTISIGHLSFLTTNIHINLTAKPRILDTLAVFFFELSRIPSLVLMVDTLETVLQ